MNNKKELLGNISERTLKNYSNFFEKKKLSILTIEENGTLIELKKNIRYKINPGTKTSIEKTDATVSNINNKNEKKDNSNIKKIIAPIIGTFYASTTPSAPPYVKVGDQVYADTKIGIIEAMKVMNEISAGVSGKIVEILVKDNEVVQAGQPIMTVE